MTILYREYFNKRVGIVLKINSFREIEGLREHGAGFTGLDLKPYVVSGVLRKETEESIKLEDVKSHNGSIEGLEGSKSATIPRELINFVYEFEERKTI